MSNYIVYQTGPDNNSTYPECWGNASTSPGRKIGDGKTLVDLIEVIDALDHDNFWIRGKAGLCVAGSRDEFYRLPRVRGTLKWAKDGRARVGGEG